MGTAATEERAGVELAGSSKRRKEAEYVGQRVKNGGVMPVEQASSGMQQDGAAARTAAALKAAVEAAAATVVGAVGR